MKRLLLPILLIGLAFAVHAQTSATLPPNLDPGTGKSIVDAHVHVAGLGYGDSGCFVNETMRDNIRFRFCLWAMGVSEEELEQHGDRVLFAKLSHAIAESTTVDKTVILALDGYVTEDGTALLRQTRHVVNRALFAFQMRSHTDDRTDSDYARATNAIDQYSIVVVGWANDWGWQ